jgi:hypothetical protein
VFLQFELSTVYRTSLLRVEVRRSDSMDRHGKRVISGTAFHGVTLVAWELSMFVTVVRTECCVPVVR